MPPYRLVKALLVAGAVVACDQATSAEPPPSASNSAQPAAASAATPNASASPKPAVPIGATHPESLAIGSQAPNFELPGLGKQAPKQPLSLQSLRGNVVALYFWASWCVGCRIQGPIMQQIAEQFAGKPVKVLGVNGDDTRELAERANQQSGYGFPSVFDSGAAILRSYGAQRMPTVVIIDAEGRIRYAVMRVVGAPKLVQEIDAALNN